MQKKRVLFSLVVPTGRFSNRGFKSLASKSTANIWPARYDRRSETDIKTCASQTTDIKPALVFKVLTNGNLKRKSTYHRITKFDSRTAPLTRPKILVWTTSKSRAIIGTCAGYVSTRSPLSRRFVCRYCSEFS